MTRNERIGSGPRARAGAAGCALLSCLIPISSLAADPALDEGTGGEAAARVLFTEARKLVAGGDYLAACPKFEESFRLDPGIGTGFNLADCWEHVGRTASAWARFLAVAASAKAAGQPDREHVARDRAAALEPALARLVVEVKTPEEGLAVARDGVPVREASWGLPVPLDPGVHVIEVTAPRKKKWSLSVTVPPAGSTMSVTVPKLEDEPPPPPAPAVLRPPGPGAPTERLLAAPRPPEPRSLAPAIVAGAVGIVGLATGGIFALELQSVNDRSKAICPTSMGCSIADKSMHDSLLNEARRDRAVVYVGLSVGAVAVLVAALLWSRPVIFAPSATRARNGAGAGRLAWVPGSGAGVAWPW